MKTSKNIFWSIIDALGVAVYAVLVALFLNNAGKVFGPVGPANGFIVPAAMLMLLVLSAAITGLLVLGRPIYLIYSGQKKKALKCYFTLSDF